MSEHTPITGELRDAVEWEPTFCGPDRAMVPQPEFDRICDAIDAVHAGLERENAELRERLVALENRSDSMHIGSATITVTPRLDWTGVARKLRSIADTLSSCNCSNDCTNGERTEACLPHFWTHDGTLHVELPKLPDSISVRLPDERDRDVSSARVWQYTRDSGTCHDVGDPSDFCCSECGVRMFTDTSDTYTMIASDGRTIIKHPNFCPNCGRRIEVDG